MDDEQRKELLERRAAREKAAEAEAQARADQVLELEDKLSGLNSKRGRDFEIVNSAEGVFALKRLHALAWKAWQDYLAKVGDGKVDPEAILNTVLGALVEPAPEVFKSWVHGTNERPGCPGIVGAALGVINQIHGVSLQFQLGK
jgi:hypothetical protein